MIVRCPVCSRKVAMSGSVPISVGRYWTVGNHYFCPCGMIGRLYVGHGKMQGKDKMVWGLDKEHIHKQFKVV